jgi:PAS domain S-box-containing protein
MKILYLAHERDAARAAAPALRTIAPNVTVTWAPGPDAALDWLCENPDARAVIVDADTQDQGCPPFLEQVRGLGVATPVVVLTPEHLEGLLAVLKGTIDAAVDQECYKSEILEAQLKTIDEWRRQAQQRLIDTQAHQDAALTRSTKICLALQERLLELEVVLHTADQRLAEQTAAAERLARRESELTGALEEAVTARHHVEKHLQDVEQRHAAELTSVTTQFAERETQHTTSLRRANRIGTALQERLFELETATRHADDRRVADAAAIDQLMKREAELSAAVSEALAGRLAVENRLTEAEAAHDRAQQLTRADLAAAAARYAALEREADGLRRQLDAMRTHAAALRRDAERIPALQLQLEESLKENRRQFERAPYGLCECTRDGAITRVNHALARLLGYRSGADLLRMDVAATVFESPGDLRWLLERAARTGKLQSVDTILNTRDHRRLSVRLLAQTDDTPMTIAVEDLTKLRAAEQRLREAQRMEAVGRVASEVAVTCDTLLRDVSDEGRQWLAAFDRDTQARQRGELLLGDVSRAASYLRQFVVYGQKQITNLEPVSVRRVLSDLEPVLKQVLGDDITLVLPKTTELFEVDVDAEPVERMLVNIAHYARQRMPQGGRVRVQLAATVVDREFLAHHPKVRPGSHVVITITEIQGAIRPALPIPSPIPHGARAFLAPPLPERPGMDLGPLVALIHDLGGHLWMAAEAAGNLTLQIHLPKRTNAEVVESPVAVSWSSRGRQLARWFRH